MRCDSSRPETRSRARARSAAVDGERVALGPDDEILFRGAEAGIGDVGAGNGGREDGLFDEVVINGIGLDEAQAAIHLENGEDITLVGNGLQDFEGNVAGGLGGARERGDRKRR